MQRHWSSWATLTPCRRKFHLFVSLWQDDYVTSVLCNSRRIHCADETERPYLQFAVLSVNAGRLPPCWISGSCLVFSFPSASGQCSLMVLLHPNGSNSSLTWFELSRNPPKSYGKEWDAQEYYNGSERLELRNFEMRGEPARQVPGHYC
jgi:hypothetical protein